MAKAYIHMQMSLVPTAAAHAVAATLVMLLQISVQQVPTGCWRVFVLLLPTFQG